MMAQGAFGEAIKSETPFDIVKHTASPFKYDAPRSHSTPSTRPSRAQPKSWPASSASQRPV
ncbi:hypothetical protein P171DRAFT_427994, partial [Karstenula rhodostoma CBS 690.94]